jgi:autotransporter-associated beta strand protein
VRAAGPCCDTQGRRPAVALRYARGTNPNGGTNAANQGGKLALAKSGSGTLTLSNANTYSGGTVLNTGTLVVGNDNALGSGDLTMAAGTALSFQGSRTIANNIGLTGDPTFTVNAGTTSTISGVISTSPGPQCRRPGRGRAGQPGAVGDQHLQRGDHDQFRNAGVVGHRIDRAVERRG